MPLRVNQATPVVSASSELKIPTGTFKVIGDGAPATFIEIRRLPDGTLRLAGAPVANGPRGLGGDPKDLNWATGFERVGYSKNQKGVDGERNAFESSAATTMRGGALVQTEQTVYPGSWLKKDVKYVSEQSLKLENGDLVFTRRQESWRKGRGGWELQGAAIVSTQTLQKV